MISQTNDYLAQQVESADPAHLVELLFQRAVRDLQSARELWPDQSQRVESIRLVVHAQSILNELSHCLNFEQGGALANDLYRLYEYMQFRLMEAVQAESGDGAQVGEVLDLLSSLSDAWSEMVRQQLGVVPESVLSEGKVLVA
jgi:flagellar protein FliS